MWRCCCLSAPLPTQVSAVNRAAAVRSVAVPFVAASPHAAVRRVAATLATAAPAAAQLKFRATLAIPATLATHRVAIAVVAEWYRKAQAVVAWFPSRHRLVARLVAAVS